MIAPASEADRAALTGKGAIESYLTECFGLSFGAEECRRQLILLVLGRLCDNGKIEFGAESRAAGFAADGGGALKHAGCGCAGGRDFDQDVPGEEGRQRCEASNAQARSGRVM